MNSAEPVLLWGLLGCPCLLAEPWGRQPLEAGQLGMEDSQRVQEVPKASFRAQQGTGAMLSRSGLQQDTPGLWLCYFEAWKAPAA